MASSSRGEGTNTIGECNLPCLGAPVEHAPSMLALREFALDVLHVPYTYFPDAAGGTEVYVRSLIAALRAHGLECGVAIPGMANKPYVHEGVPVFQFARARTPTFASAYGAPDEDAARSFRTLLARVRPRIVHLHSRTAAVSELLVDVAREEGAKVVFTYHTPTVSCARGTLMRFGRTPCDGKLHVRNCTACVLQGHGVPPVLRDALAAAPQVLGEALATRGTRRRGFHRAAHVRPCRQGPSPLRKLRAEG